MLMSSIGLLTKKIYNKNLMKLNIQRLIDFVGQNSTDYVFINNRQILFHNKRKKCYEI